MIEFTLGIIYASFLEWWIHKKLFHEVGRKKNNWFSFHLRDHHAVSKKNNFVDERISRREAVGLCALGSIHSIVCYVSPLFFFATLAYALAFLYYTVTVTKTLIGQKNTNPGIGATIWKTQIQTGMLSFQ